MNTMFHALDCQCHDVKPARAGRTVTHDRSVMLYGTLTGRIWMPAIDAELPVDEDLASIARRFVNADGSGLVDAVKSVVDGAGDFQSAKLTPDSYVLIKHERPYQLWGRTIHGFSRYVMVKDLPSLADYVAAD
jgi:hypothetical protein